VFPLLVDGTMLWWRTFTEVSDSLAVYMLRARLITFVALHFLRLI